ncbi:MAG: DUF5312 family protein [Spirochaetia bacterium]
MEQKNWVMEKLARSLTEKERRQFLKQIHNSLRDDAAEQHRLDRVDTSQEEIKVRLRQEIRRMSPFRYIVLLIKKVFSGKTIEQVVLDYKLNRLRHIVRHKEPGLVSFETRTLKPLMAERVFDLFVYTIPLKHFLEKLWKEEREIGTFHQLVYNIIERQIGVEVETCYDLLSLEEMVKLYRASGSKDAIIQETNTRLDKYVESIDKSHFQRIEEILSPFYHLRDLVLFPFSRFFGMFHGTIRPDNPEYQPLFQKTSAVAMLDELEELYYALYNAAQTKVSRHFDADTVREIFDTLYPSRGSEAEGKQNASDISEEELVRDDDLGQEEPSSEVDTDAEKFIGDIERLIDSADGFLKKVPLPQLIRAFKEDPYYRLVVYFPRIDAVSFYRTMKKLTMRGEIHEKIAEVRKEALAQERSELFKNVKMRALHFYRSYSSIDYEKLGITPFRYYQALLVLFNFLSTFYRGNIQKVLQLLDGMISEQDRITRERLLKHSSACEDVLYKISELDDSMSPDQDDGKKFQKLRFENTLDPVQQRIYQAIVIKKDREASELVTQGREAARGIRLLFQDFLQNREPQIVTNMEKRYLLQGQALTLKEVLRQNVDRILLLELILNQLDQIRDETGFDEVVL